MIMQFSNRGLSAHKKAFTLVELLVALSITSIVLAAVATFAYAMMVADVTSDDASRKQAQLRYSTFRITELIRYSNLICRSSTTDIAVWTADSDSDGEIGIAELVYIETDGSDSYIRLTEFSDTGQESKRFTINQISNGSAKTWLNAQCTPAYTVLVPTTSSVEFVVDQAAPDTNLVGILFDITENDITKTYQINAALRSKAP